MCLPCYFPIGFSSPKRSDVNWTKLGKSGEKNSIHDDKVTLTVNLVNTNFMSAILSTFYPCDLIFFFREGFEYHNSKS